MSLSMVCWLPAYALVWDAEDEPAKDASPANLEESPKSHPTTPSKRKTSPTVAQPSTSNKSHKGMSLLCCPLSEP